MTNISYELAKKGGYYAIHAWLRYHYGSADTCENSDCQGYGKRFEWALIQGKEHGHDRGNYMMLCKPCHMVYDKVHQGEKSYRWKGGKPSCSRCERTLSQYSNQTGLCGTCNRQVNPPWLGKSRKIHNTTNA